MQKKLLAVLMVLVLCVSMLAGCGEGTSGSEETEGKTQASTQTGTEDQTLGENDSTEAVRQDPVTLKVWVPENLRVDWDNNKMTEWLEEQANVDLVFEVLSSADYDEKVNVSLTVGDVSQLPDIILGKFKNDMVWKYAQAETILPLNEYYNDPELAKNINASVEACGYDYVDEIISADGNIYGIAYYNQSYGNEYPDKMWIYKPWLDALGEDVPTTTDEFYQLLKKVSETDLNGNGKKDEIPLAGATKNYDGYFEFLMNSFVYAGGTDYRLFDDNGVASAAFVTEEWKEGLAYISKLFDEGLILSESLTMDDKQFLTVLNAEEQTVFAFDYMAANNAVRSADYIGIDTLTGPDGVNWATFVPSSATVALLVTANCENPEAAFRVGDLMSSEKIGISQRFGWEGIDWDYAENVKDISSRVAYVEGWDLSIVLYDDVKFWSGTEVQYSSWLQRGPYVRAYGIANGRAVDPSTLEQTTKILNEVQKMYQDGARHPKYSPKVLNFTDAESEEISDIATSLSNYVKEFRAGVLSGNIDLDAEWDNYLKELEEIGLEKWLDVLTDAFARMYK